MSSPSLRDIFAQREKQLREYIFFQPVSNLVDNPWAVANAIDKFAETQGRMMIFKRPKVEVTRAQLTTQQPSHALSSSLARLWESLLWSGVQSFVAFTAERFRKA